MPTIIEVDSDEEEIQPSQTIKTSKIKQENKEGEEMVVKNEREMTSSEEEPTQEESEKQKEMPKRRDTIQEERISRQGKRQRHKTDFHGQNVMLTRIESL